jgi:hypothetical protein
MRKLLCTSTIEITVLRTRFPLQRVRVSGGWFGRRNRFGCWRCLLHSQRLPARTAARARCTLAGDGGLPDAQIFAHLIEALLADSADGDQVVDAFERAVRLPHLQNLLSVAGPIPGTSCNSSDVAELRLMGLSGGFLVAAEAAFTNTSVVNNQMSATARRMENVKDGEVTIIVDNNSEAD